MTKQDDILRFMFDGTDVRGEIVTLQESYHAAVVSHNYPAGVRNLLGEFVAAATLLSSTLKFSGSVILQAKSDGQIPTIMAECSNDFRVRAIARDAENATGMTFNELFEGGTLLITIEPLKGKRYQGIVTMNGETLGECLGEYFRQSEQLNTQFWLCANENTASGFMLQELPVSTVTDASKREEHWEHFAHLASTIQPEELVTLDHETLLYRLYHQDHVRLFDSRPVRFGCSCSEQRTAGVIKSIGRNEAEEIIQEQGVIQVVCEFCNHIYHFDSKAIAEIFSDEAPPIH